MIALVQRAASASVVVDGATVGAIGAGLLVLLGVVRDDTDTEGAWLADRVARLRLFADDEGRMNRSLMDTGADALVVSQFTLAGTLDKGTRPSFIRAAPPDTARDLYERFVAHLASHLGRPVATGRFGAEMAVHHVGNGPVTLWVEKRPPGTERR